MSRLHLRLVPSEGSGDGSNTRLPPPTGGGTPPDMERIAKLETWMEVVRTDVAALKADIRDVRDRSIKLEERVSHLPTKGWAVGVILTALTAVGALVTLAPKLQAYFGTASQAAKAVGGP
ncbi:hypothetical protein [Methylobacterium sp. A54F]